ncbi:MAG: PaaI family thioesterase [Phycisphaeraceae bacterium]|nr:PaaI family thioesterase [Phycisphaeraceae bacterium]
MQCHNPDQCWQHDDNAGPQVHEAMVIEQFERDQFAVANGIHVVEVGRGFCRAKMEATDRHLNSLGMLHGGAIFTLADVAFAAAANACGDAAVSINAGVNYLRAGTAGTIWAEARQVSCSRKMAVFDVRVTDESGQTLAILHGLAYRLDPRSGSRKEKSERAGQ